MVDHEKVIKGLKYLHDRKTWKEGPMVWDDKPQERRKITADAIAQLKAQDNTVCTKERCPMNASTISDNCDVKTCPWRTEAVEPRLSISGLWYECPVCGRHLTQYEDNYCARCGKRVKWG